jgi:hypothetical protein
MASWHNSLYDEHIDSAVRAHVVNTQVRPDLLQRKRNEICLCFIELSASQTSVNEAWSKKRNIIFIVYCLLQGLSHEIEVSYKW